MFEPAAPEIAKAQLPRWVIGMFIVVIGAWLLTPIFFYCVAKFGADQAGQVGDAFGAINALFSGLAFAGVLWAIHLQQKQLEEQRREVQQTIEEQKVQARIFSEQSATMRRTARLAAIPNLIEHEVAMTSLFLKTAGISHQATVIGVLATISQVSADKVLLEASLRKPVDPLNPQLYSTSIRPQMQRMEAEYQLSILTAALAHITRLNGFLDDLRSEYGALKEPGPGEPPTTDDFTAKKEK